MASIIPSIFTIFLVLACHTEFYCDGTPVAVAHKCQCAYFDNRDTQTGSGVPIMKSPTKTACVTTDFCQGMCIAQALLIDDDIPDVICAEVYERSDPFKFALYSSNCSSINEWVFTGLVAVKSMTCHDGEPSVIDAD